jgi:hypothetical protein
MTERRVIGLRDRLANAERLVVLPLFWRALVVACLLATAPVPREATAATATSSATLVPAGSGPAVGCDAQSMRPDPGPVGATEAACTAPDVESDQAYLVETARPGATMLRQGIALAIVRLHPMFVRRLAEAISEARGEGLPSAGIFSAYRPPAFGVGGFSDKFNSLHTYGLAVDMLGVGRPGSNEAKLWYEIAARHGIVCPYGAGNRREWNHCQPTSVKSIIAGNPLRGTVSPHGPVDLGAMFAMGDALVNGSDAESPELQPASDEKGAAGRAESIETRHDQADPRHERHRQIKSVAGSFANLAVHEAHGQPKRRAVAESASGKSGPVKTYRTASLVRRYAVVAGLHPASSNEHVHAKRINAENARLDRLVKGICRGC